MLLQIFCHPCSLVALLPGQIFFCWNCHQVVFWLNQIVRDLRGFLPLVGVDKKERKKEREKEKKKIP